MVTAAPLATSTYQLTTGIKLDIEDLIHQISPIDIPLQGMAVGATDGIGLPTGSVFEKKYSWLDETLLTPRSTVAATSTTGELDLKLAAADGLKFQTGDVVLVGAEYMRVTGYSATTADYLRVTRAVSGSAATVATSADVIGVGSLLAEGSNPPDARFLDRNKRDNYTEIFGPTQIKSTNSDLAIQKYGITNEFDHQVANRMKEMAIAIDQAIAYGAQIEDLTNNWRSFNGIAAHITSNVDSSTTTLTLAAIQTQMQNAYNAGGMPDQLMVGPKQTTVISAFTSGGTVQVQRGDGTAGRVIRTIETDFGTLHVLLNRWIRTLDVHGFNRDQCQVVTLRPMQFQALAITGDAVPAMIVAEKGFKFYRQQHAFKFTALT